MLHLLSSLALVAGFGTATVDSTELRREDLMTALRSGGYTVLLRHARTDRSFNEVREYVPKERSAQRNLTDEGIRDAALMGVVFRKYGISFAEIISSPMFRCVETAEYAAGTPTSTTMDLRVFPATPEQAALVKKAPKPGTNRLLVTHHFVLETHVPGIQPGDIGESEAAVVRHLPGGKIELVGRITLDDWRALANPGQAATPDPSHANAGAHGSVATSPHAAPNYGPTNGPSPNIPDTHAGHLAREYIAAFNSGSPDKMRAYIDAYMVADAARPTEERLKPYAKLFDEHGALSVVMVGSSTALEVVLGMRSKRGNFRLTVKASDAQPMRASSVTFTLMEGSHR
jgi:phosphohistidine phosphatase SixA